MNFSQFVNNDKQKLVNDLHTVRNSLNELFDLRDESRNSESFKLSINGVANIRGGITKDTKIILTFTGVDKYKRSYDRADVEATLNNVLLKNITTKVNHTDIERQYCYTTIAIEFESLTESVVKDIMYLTQNTDAKLRPNRIGRF